MYSHTREMNNLNEQKSLIEMKQCGKCEEDILFKLEIQNKDMDVIIQFIDTAVEISEKELMKHIIKNNDFTRIYCYNDYWMLYQNLAKKKKELLYLKENQYEELITDINDFLLDDTRTEYLKYGIPYKRVYLLHGTPGCGKTSTINTIASEINSDIYIIPLSNECQFRLLAMIISESIRSR